MDKVVLSKNNEKVRELLERIKLAISQKAMVDGRRQDANSKTYLGNVSFWFQRPAEPDKPDKNPYETYEGPTYLVFDRDPVGWDLDRIHGDLLVLEHRLLKHVAF